MSEGLRSSLSGVQYVVDVTREAAGVDDLDLAILERLAHNARASQRALSKELGVSTPTIGERMARLERSGVVRGYSITVDWAALGLAETVFLSITASTDYDVAEIMTRLWQIPEVEEVHLVTGELDLLTRVRVRDSNHLRTLLMTTIWQIPGIQRTVTMSSVAEMPAKDLAVELIRTLRTSGA
jgi:Lrp/AsnC family transcriptional regulator, leucine-responsive regulatory protein